MTRRALVLSGGGPVGIAWETGIVAGLAEEGVRLGEADLIVGTSAGSVVGAQLAMGRDPLDMLESQLTSEETASVGAVRQQGRQGSPSLSGLIEIMTRAASEGWSMEKRLLEMGRFALSAETIDEEAFVAGFGSRLSGAGDWPDKDFVCAAIDAETGEFRVWDRTAGAPLARAVASSCAVPGIYPPVTINGRRYYDGGLRSAINADLAAGCETAVVITLYPPPEAELSALRSAGASAVEPVIPDEASARAIGVNVMDARLRFGAAENGRRQGRAEAPRLKSVWK